MEENMDLEKAINLREQGKLNESNTLLQKLVKKNPNNAILNYQYAWSFDVLEMEVEAIKYYERSIELELPDEYLKEAYLGLGSTYRCIGKYIQAKDVFEKALARFDDNSLRVFYAMTLYNLEEHENSMNILLKLLAQTSNDKTIINYAKAIDFYSDKLDKLFN